VETTCATVLFADMRGYTGLAERLPPARVVTLLDEFFGVLASATEAYDGEVFHNGNSADERPGLSYPLRTQNVVVC
jgi:hypothetical protein